MELKRARGEVVGPTVEDTDEPPRPVNAVQVPTEARRKAQMKIFERAKEKLVAKAGGNGGAT